MTMNDRGIKINFVIYKRKMEVLPRRHQGTKGSTLSKIRVERASHCNSIPTCIFGWRLGNLEAKLYRL